MQVLCGDACSSQSVPSMLEAARRVLAYSSLLKCAREPFARLNRTRREAAGQLHALVRRQSVVVSAGRRSKQTGTWNCIDLQRPTVALNPEDANCIVARPFYKQRCYYRHDSDAGRAELVAIVWEDGIRTKATLIVCNQTQDRVSDRNACTLQRCGAVTYRPTDGDCYRLRRVNAPPRSITLSPRRSAGRC